MKPSLPDARLSLLASTALSSTYPTSLKLLYAAEGAALDPFAITAIRFSLMAGCAQVILNSDFGLNSADSDSASSTSTVSSSSASQSSGFWCAAAELGFWACAGAQLNTAGLQQISVVRGTILLASINIMTPILCSLIGTTTAQRQVSSRTWGGCVLALASTIFALLDGDLTSLSPDLTFGDDLVLGAALCYATQQVRLGSLVAAHSAPRLAAARLQTQAACSLGVLAVADGGGGADGGRLAAAAPEGVAQALEWAGHLSPVQLALLLVSALVSVTGTILQYRGQATVPAASAQPIYASAPILAALWACLVLNEPISSSEAAGGLGIGAAALLASSSAARVKRGESDTP